MSFHRSRFLLANAFYVSFLRNLFFVRKSQYLWYKKENVNRIDHDFFRFGAPRRELVFSAWGLLLLDYWWRVESVAWRRVGWWQDSLVARWPDNYHTMRGHPILRKRLEVFLCLSAGWGSLWEFYIVVKKTTPVTLVSNWTVCVQHANHTVIYRCTSNWHIEVRVPWIPFQLC